MWALKIIARIKSTLNFFVNLAVWVQVFKDKKIRMKEWSMSHCDLYMEIEYSIRLFSIILFVEV